MLHNPFARPPWWHEYRSIYSTELSFVAQIAGELGFAEPSAFHRAFKVWTGLRPGDYRQRSGVERP